MNACNLIVNLLSSTFPYAKNFFKLLIQQWSQNDRKINKKC